MRRSRGHTGLVDVLLVFLLAWFVASVLAAALLGLRRSRRAVHLAPRDIAELDAIARRVMAEHHAHIAPSLECALGQIHGRQVPLARVTRGAAPRQWILHFADGSAILVAGRPGDAGIVAMTLQRTRVLLVEWRDRDDRYVLRLGWSGGSIDLEALGSPHGHKVD